MQQTSQKGEQWSSDVIRGNNVPYVGQHMRLYCGSRPATVLFLYADEIMWHIKIISSAFLQFTLPSLWIAWYDIYISSSSSSGSIHCWVGCNELPPVVPVLCLPCCLHILYNTNFSRGGNFRYFREFGFCAKFSSRENNIYCEWNFAKFSSRENKILIAV